MRPAAGEAEQAREMLLRALIPARAPGALERGREAVQARRGVGREEVGYSVHGSRDQAGRGRGSEAEEGHHAVDVHEQHGPATASFHDLAR